jgi:hypothetical protein
MFSVVAIFREKIIVANNIIIKNVNKYVNNKNHNNNDNNKNNNNDRVSWNRK